jgi:aminoglycoside phosphotransferase (APT) family kinase protein
MSQDPHARLRAVAAHLGRPVDGAVLVASDSNDVWRIGDAVLRVCWRGDLARFGREALVTAHLPVGVPYPPVLDSGADGSLAWQVTGAVDGVPLSSVWRALGVPERRDAVHQIGRALAALHAHRFPPAVVEALAAPPTPPTADIRGRAGVAIVPVPHGLALQLTEHLPGVPGIDDALVRAVRARLRDLAPYDPFAAGGAGFGCVHGDAHPANVLWRNGAVVALLDLEWARWGPADLDLEPYLRPGVADLGIGEDERRRVLGWLAEAHPRAFAAPDLDRRMSLYRLASAVRQVVIAPSDPHVAWLRSAVRR